MWFFWLFSYFAGYVAVMFLAFSVACGMYYLADLAEEYPTYTHRMLKYTIWFVLGCHVALWLLEGLPIVFVLVGILSHVAYHMLLGTFPVLNYTSIEFVLSAAGLALSHVVWLWHFTSPVYYPVGHKMAFFFVCVWIVPFGFCLSLSVNDNVLPGNADGALAGRSRKANVCKWLLDVCRQHGSNVLPTSGQLHRNE